MTLMFDFLVRSGQMTVCMWGKLRTPVRGKATPMQPAIHPTINTGQIHPGTNKNDEYMHIETHAERQLTRIYAQRILFVVGKDMYQQQANCLVVYEHNLEITR